MKKWFFAKHKNPGSLTGLGEPNGTCPTHWWRLTNPIESYKDNASITPWLSLRVTTVWTSLGNNLMWGGYQISDEMGFCSTGGECVGSDTVHRIVLLLTSDWSRSYKSPMFERCYFGSSWRLVETVASLRRGVGKTKRASSVVVNEQRPRVRSAVAMSWYGIKAFWGFRDKDTAADKMCLASCYDDEQWTPAYVRQCNDSKR